MNPLGFMRKTYKGGLCAHLIHAMTQPKGSLTRAGAHGQGNRETSLAQVSWRGWLQDSRHVPVFVCIDHCFPVKALAPW